MKGTSLGMLLLAAAAGGWSTRASADDLLGFYVGAAIGDAHVRTSQSILGDTGYVYPFDEQHLGWKLMAGIRPISPLGAELEYIDFGSASDSHANSGFGGVSQASAKAVALFGVAYLPIPAPFLDVYAKFGVARAHTTAQESPPIPVSPAPVSPLLICVDPAPGCHTTTGSSNSSTNLAYGAGVQGKFGPLAVRAEYERLAVSGGNPDLFSVGVTWTF